MALREENTRPSPCLSTSACGSVGGRGHVPRNYRAPRARPSMFLRSLSWNYEGSWRPSLSNESVLIRIGAVLPRAISRAGKQRFTKPRSTGIVRRTPSDRAHSTLRNGGEVIAMSSTQRTARSIPPSNPLLLAAPTFAATSEDLYGT
jgi:hypothetical protein